MREFRTYGSVRGAVGNDRPYLGVGSMAGGSMRRLRRNDSGGVSMTTSR